VKDRLTDLILWIAAILALFLVLYFLASPMIHTNGQGRMASPLLVKLNGPVIHVLESDFKGPMLWYFGLWGIEIEYFAREPVPNSPWYAGPAYALLALGSAIALAYPLWRSRFKKWLRKRRTTACTGLLDDTQLTCRKSLTRSQ